MDYWTSNVVLDITQPHKTGTVTTIFDIDNLSLYDQLLVIDGMDVVGYGNFVLYPRSEGRWTTNHPFIATDEVAPNKRYAFVPGRIEDGTRKKIARLSSEFKKVTQDACESFFENVDAGVSVHYSHNIYESMYFKSIFFH